MRKTILAFFFIAGKYHAVRQEILDVKAYKKTSVKIYNNKKNGYYQKTIMV